MWFVLFHRNWVECRVPTSRLLSSQSHSCRKRTNGYANKYDGTSGPSDVDYPSFVCVTRGNQIKSMTLINKLLSRGIYTRERQKLFSHGLRFAIRIHIAGNITESDDTILETRFQCHIDFKLPSQKKRETNTCAETTGIEAIGGVASGKK